MKKKVVKRVVLFLMVTVMALLFAFPALAAPATVEVDNESFTKTYTDYYYQLDKTFEINYDVSLRTQVVKNDNLSFVKWQVLAKGTAVDVATGDVYQLSKFIHNSSKMSYDSNLDLYTYMEQLHFIGPGPDNNLFVTYTCTYKNGELKMYIDSIEIR